MEELIFIGNITSTHRLDGTLKVNTTFPLLNDIVGLNVIIQNKDGDIKVLKIKEIKGITNKRALFSFENISNIDDAKKILSYKIFIRKDLVPDYEEDETVLGYSVYNKNEYIGLVEDILETAAHDILIVMKDEKEIMIPYIDVFVLEVNDENKRIEVELIEGMI